MQRVSGYFRLGKSQAELDFVDVPANRDMPLFVDPFAVSVRPDPWSRDCHATIVTFFTSVLEALRQGKRRDAEVLLGHLREPNETHLGVSRAEPRGAGVGWGQAQEIADALAGSAAVETGFLTSLEECELVVPGIARDKISDLTTNIIRGHLATYTRDQCQLLGIPATPVNVGPGFIADQGEWVSEYHELPLVRGKPVLLVPKAIARWDPAYDYGRYYDAVIEFLQAEHLDAGTSLVRTLKNGQRRVYKRDVKGTFPQTKRNLLEFSRKHPEFLERYRKELEGLEKRGRDGVVKLEEEQRVALMLQEALRQIPAGDAHAGEYHSLMVGVVEFLFYPALLHPTKEKEIHQGRKRIDIVMENGAYGGPLWRLHAVKKVPCAYVPIECKNYRTEVSNPELDQLAGRFGVNRGMFGLLCCRRFEDRGKFLERCRDTWKDGRGLVLGLDDDVILGWLGAVAQRGQRRVEDGLRQMIDEAIAS